MAYVLHVDGDRIGCRVSRAVNDDLAWQARNVRTGSADQPAFNDGSASSCFGQCPCDVLSRLTTADYEDVVALDRGHDGCLQWCRIRSADPYCMRMMGLIVPPFSLSSAA